MATDFYDDYDEALPKRKDHLFLWTIFILLLIGVAFACWIGSFYIFGHPEQARSYRLLVKLKKLEPIRRFEVIAAPQGEFFGAQKLYDHYSTLTPLELQNENAELLRIYVKNYTETKRLVPYVRGRFTVINAYELTGADMFTHGTVALMQADDSPQVLVEHIFPTTGSNSEECKRLLVPGFGLAIEKTSEVTAIIHVERFADGRLLLTVMPLHYPQYGVKGGAGTFATRAADGVECRSGHAWCSSKAPACSRASRTLAKMPAKEATSTPARAGRSRAWNWCGWKTPDVVKTPPTGVVPEVPTATPIPRCIRRHPWRCARRRRLRPCSRSLFVPRICPHRGRSRSSRAIAAGQLCRRFRRPVPTTTPPVAPPPIAPARRHPAVGCHTAGGRASHARDAGPDRFAARACRSSRSVKSAALPVPPPEKTAAVGAPIRRASFRRAAVGHAYGNRRPRGSRRREQSGSYLRGNFLVTASGDNKAVLRPQGGDAAAAGAPNMRVSIDGFSDRLGAARGRRDIHPGRRARGFQVVDVRRSQDGTVNVFVREITQP